jgi:hypothetical protein
MAQFSEVGQVNLSRVAFSTRKVAFGSKFRMTMLDTESELALSIEAKAKDKCIAATGREK